MQYLASIVGGLVAGLIGAAVWGGIAYATGYEIGWIAWGIGAMVGFAVLVCGRMGVGADDAGGPVSLGVIAVVFTLLSISAGKFLTVDLLLRKEIATYTNREAMEAYFGDPDVAVSYVAARIVNDRLEAGQAVETPADANPDDESYRDDYPADVGAAAQNEWDAMEAADQQAFRDAISDAIRAGYHERRVGMEFEIFKESFGLMDLVFFGLAVFTAFKIGSAPVEEPEPQAGPDNESA